ncbi:MAG: aminotransferase class I/II-fold pyridoxal phosphate-dependent enzyme, partial [Chloroflexota bacterium]
MRLFIEPGDLIVNCPPTFGMYSFDAGVNAARVINVWRRPDFSLAIDQIEAVFDPPPPRAASGGVPKLIFVTSPNNPDGSLLGNDDLRRLLALPAVVVLDEAYVEFCSQPSRIQWVRQYPNLIVLRTFSKWAGLAGLRVGYGGFPLPIIDHLWKIKQPYNVPVTGQVAALVSLQDRACLLERVARLVEQREKTLAALARLKWLEPHPSQANFILCRIKDRPGAVVKQQLAGRGILVRYYNSPGLADHVRISIGAPAHMAQLEQVLNQL